MSDVITAAQADIETRLRWVRELQKSEAYRGIIIPEFERLSREHAEALRDRTLTAEKRCEHVEASHMADDLRGFLKTQEELLLIARKRGK